MRHWQLDLVEEQMNHGYDVKIYIKILPLYEFHCIWYAVLIKVMIVLTDTFVNMKMFHIFSLHFHP